LATFDLKQYALRGAQARVQELQQELTAIYRAFPGLRRGGGAAAAAASSGRPVRRRKPMSAAQKREVSRRMKKYWAERRKANAK
jgi:hypothetical protein